MLDGLIVNAVGREHDRRICRRGTERDLRQRRQRHQHPEHRRPGPHRHPGQLHRHRPVRPQALGNRLDGILLNGVTGTVISGSALPNVISGNAGSGIHSIGSSGQSVIQANRIGTDLSGTSSLGNGNQGIALEDAGGNTVGGLAAGQGNLISGNGDHGIRIYSANSTGNLLLGNTIGTDATGTSPLGNGGFGISIESTSGTLVQSDLVSGNVSGGIQITGFGASGNVIYGCTIGTDRGGAIALGNGLASQNDGIGVFVNGAAGNRIGGTDAGQGNLISGNATAGVYLFGRFASGNTVQGNRIGTNASGLRPLQAGSTLDPAGRGPDQPGSRARPPGGQSRAWEHGRRRGGGGQPDLRQRRRGHDQRGRIRGQRRPRQPGRPGQQRRRRRGEHRGRLHQRSARQHHRRRPPPTSSRATAASASTSWAAHQPATRSPATSSAWVRTARAGCPTRTASTSRMPRGMSSAGPRRPRAT